MFIGDRVHVESRDFGGMATIMYIADGEIYPIQIELDKGDEDGHKVKRIAAHEIIQDGQETPEPAAATFTGADDPQQYIGDVVDENSGYGFKAGQQFILGVVKFPGVHKPGPAKSFYLYETDSLAFRGCMPATMFGEVVPYDPALVRPKPARHQITKITIKQTKTKPANHFKPEKHVPDEQLNIFDFLEA